MKVIATSLPEVLRIEPDVYGDARGYFMESYSERRYAEHGIALRFVQDNLSSSRRDILRGLHVQSPPHGQGKLVQVLDGEVFDVAVDVRLGSPSFGQWVGERLSADNRFQLYVPPGFAHGFCVTSERALLSYKCTGYYAPAAELSIQWNDPEIGIDWPTAEPVLSNKDAAGLRLRDVERARLPRFPGA